MGKIALIDGDPIVYSVAFALQQYALLDIEYNGHMIGVFNTTREAKQHAEDIGLEEDEYIIDPHAELTEDMLSDLYEMLKEFVFSIIEDTGATEQEIVLSGQSNFRKQIDPKYKENRKKTARPILYSDVKYMLMTEFGAVLAEDGFEADDELAQTAISMINSGRPESYVICTIDKDLDTVPGWHYRWPTFNKDSNLYWVEPEQARHIYWVSVLTGDTADNIPGLHGVGPKKAEKHLIGCRDSLHYQDSCLAAYMKHYEGNMENEEIIARFHQNMELLLIGKENRDAESYSGSD